MVHLLPDPLGAQLTILFLHKLLLGQLIFSLEFRFVCRFGEARNGHKVKLY